MCQKSRSAPRSLSTFPFHPNIFTFEMDGDHHPDLNLICSTNCVNRATHSPSESKKKQEEYAILGFTVQIFNSRT